MNAEQVADVGGGLGMLMFWGALLCMLIYFSFASRGAKAAVWQANLGMFFGFLGFLILPGLLAIPLGHMARRRIKRSGGQLTGRGRATFGLVVGYCLAVYLVGMIGIVVAQELKAHADLAAIDRAKVTWAAATGAEEGALPTQNDITPFLPGKAFPSVAYKVYNINPVGVKASYALVGPTLVSADSSPPLREGRKLPPVPAPPW